MCYALRRRVWHVGAACVAAEMPVGQGVHPRGGYFSVRVTVFFKSEFGRSSHPTRYSLVQFTYQSSQFTPRILYGFSESRDLLVRVELTLGTGRLSVHTPAPLSKHACTHPLGRPHHLGTLRRTTAGVHTPVPSLSSFYNIQYYYYYSSNYRVYSPASASAAVSPVKPYVQSLR